MARISTKRKSDSMLPSGRSKSRETFKEDESETRTSDEASEGLFVSQEAPAPKYVKKNKVKARKSEPVPFRVDDEYDEDEGRMESQQFLAIIAAEVSKKKAKAKAASEFMERFNANIEKQEDALKAHRQTLATAAEEQESEFLHVFKKAYAMSRPQAAPAQSAKGKEISASLAECFSLLYDHSRNLAATAFGIIEQYEVWNAKTVSIIPPGLLENKWADENNTAEQIVTIGHQVGLEKYQAMLKGEKVPAIEEDQVLFAAAVFGTENEEEDKAVSWGGAARKLARHTKKAWKVLPAPAPAES